MSSSFELFSLFRTRLFWACATLGIAIQLMLLIYAPAHASYAAAGAWVVFMLAIVGAWFCSTASSEPSAYEQAALAAFGFFVGSYGIRVVRTTISILSQDQVISP